MLGVCPLDSGGSRVHFNTMTVMLTFSPILVEQLQPEILQMANNESCLNRELFTTPPVASGLHMMSVSECTPRNCENVAVVEGLPLLLQSKWKSLEKSESLKTWRWRGTLPPKFRGHGIERIQNYPWRSQNGFFSIV